MEQKLHSIVKVNRAASVIRAGASKFKTLDLTGPDAPPHPPRFSMSTNLNYM